MQILYLRPSPPFVIGMVVGVALSILYVKNSMTNDRLDRSAQLRIEDHSAQLQDDEVELHTGPQSLPIKSLSVATKPTKANIEMKRRGRRKVFLDCGGNAAESVELFRATYPEGDSFEIFSFEIDPVLAPYFAGLEGHRLFCPAAVSDREGQVTAWLQGPWTPKDKLQDGKEMHWGGGTLFPFKSEVDSMDGGQRGLAVRTNVTSINLARWIQKSFSVDDYVILKIDIEGSEFNVLQSLLSSGAYAKIDKWYGEIHEWAPVANQKQWKSLYRDMNGKGISLLKWEADSWFYEDMDSLHPPPSFDSAPGQPGEMLLTCRRSAAAQGQPSAKGLALGIAVGMNPLPAKQLVNTLRQFYMEKVSRGNPRNNESDMESRNKEDQRTPNSRFCDVISRIYHGVE